MSGSSTWPWKILAFILLTGLLGVYLLYEWDDEKLRAEITAKDVQLAELTQLAADAEAQKRQTAEIVEAVRTERDQVERRLQDERRQLEERIRSLEEERVKLATDLEALAAAHAAEAQKAAAIREEKQLLVSACAELEKAYEMTKEETLALRSSLDGVHETIAKTAAEHQAQIAELERHLNERVSLSRTTPMDADLLRAAQSLGILPADEPETAPTLVAQLAEAQAELRSVQTEYAAQRNQLDEVRRQLAATEDQLADARAAAGQLADAQTDSRPAEADSTPDPDQADPVAETDLPAASETLGGDLRASLAELGGVETEQGLLLRLAEAELRFESGQARLPSRLTSLDRIAALLVAHPQLRVRIEGHTDSLGADETNRALSRQRAEAIRQALTARGVTGEHISVEGLGAARPIADNATADGRQQNRRVEIYLVD